MNAHLGLGALLQALALAPAAADPAEDGAASEKAGRLREAIDHYRSALSQSLADSSEEFVLLEKPWLSPDDCSRALWVRARPSPTRQTHAK
jgi:hypothetical protein